MQSIVKLTGLAFVLSCANALAADQAPTGTVSSPATQGVTTPAADNSGMNVRDKNGMTQTPQKQTNAAEDRKLAAAVRRAVVDDKTLSTSAHNVKIVASSGVVTLRGPVRSDGEKAAVEKLAQNTAGVASVENQLDVKTQ